MHIEVAAKSDIGRDRNCNEDSLLVLKERNIFAVCDGMGGHRAGDIASQSAVKVLDHFWDKNLDEDITQIVTDINPQISDFGKRLIATVRLANRYINNMAMTSMKKSGMGTTLVLIGIEGHYAYILHVGDSRVYQFTEGHLIQLTQDHSWVNELLQDKEITEEEAKNFDYKNVITRALGTKDIVKIDIKCLPIVKESQFLLCSDGLTGAVKDTEIAAIIKKEKADPEKTVESLIDTANQHGGHDNITAILLKISNNFQNNTKSCNTDVITIHQESETIQKMEDRILLQGFGIKKKGQKIGLRKILLTGIPLIIIIALIFTLIRIKRSQNQPINNIINEQTPLQMNTDTSLSNSMAKIVFIWFDVDKRQEALVIIDGETKGTVDNFRTEGLDLTSGEHHLQVELKGKLILDRMILLKAKTIEAINIEEILQQTGE
jgi:protein phosphatase